MSSGQGLGLVADVGGTNARFALVETDGDRRRLIALEHFACAGFPSFEAALAAYLDRVGAAPHRGVVAVAGAVRGNSVHFTNLDWSITPESLAKCGYEGIRLINDYAAQALALPLLGEDRLRPLGPLAQATEGTLAVLGPGSGLGVAALVRQDGNDIPMATEGGHADFAPVDEVDFEILHLLAKSRSRVSNECVLSGGGLVRLHEALVALYGESRHPLGAGEITERGLDGDMQCRRTLLRFCAMLGSVAGNVALTLGARGGVFIAGGIAPRILPVLKDSQFRARFEAKEPMADWVRATPTLVVTDTDAALLGAARLLDSASGQGE
jgi:glucokinase